MKVDNISLRRSFLFLMVTVHKTMSKDLDEKVANVDFLTLLSRRAGVRDVSASAR